MAWQGEWSFRDARVGVMDIADSIAHLNEIQMDSNCECDLDINGVKIDQLAAVATLDDGLLKITPCVRRRVRADSTAPSHST